MSNYTKQISWSGKDALSDSDSEKVISGGDFDTEFSAVQTAINSKIDGGTITNFTSTGIDDNATSTAITIDASEKVNFQGLQINFAGASGASKGITTSEGVAGTGNMYIQAGVGSAAAGGGIRLYAHAHATKPGDVAVGISQGSGGSFRVNTTGTDGGTNLIQVDTDGLKFNGDTAAANALDDYEEGTWSPVISDAASGGNLGTTAAQQAKYTKIGNVVTVRFVLVNITTTGLTATNQINIQGLPFTSATLTNMVTPFIIIRSAITADESIIAGNVGSASSYISVTNERVAGASSAARVNQIIGGAGDMRAEFTYQTA